MCPVQTMEGALAKPVFVVFAVWGLILTGSSVKALIELSGRAGKH